MITSDALFSDDIETQWSSQGYIISLFGGLIIWKVACQATIITSTTEAELLTIKYIAKETIAL